MPKKTKKFSQIDLNALINLRYILTFISFFVLLIKLIYINYIKKVQNIKFERIELLKNEKLFN